MTHTCHARGCERPVRPTLLMCFLHWRLVPHAIKQEVYRAYRPGQCGDGRPSPAWHEAADAAIGYVSMQEHLGLTLVMAKALVKRGYAPAVIEAQVRKKGESAREAITQAVMAMEGA